MIESFRHKGLKELFETGKSAMVPPALRQRCSDRLEVLDAATDLSDLNLPGYNLHPLHTAPVRHSIHVNGPWRITFEWNAPKASRVDLEQYH
jgi:proteic killer suppression protein